MTSARLRLTAEKDNLVAEPLHGFADGVGERFDAADLGRTGQIESGVGQEEADFHAAGVESAGWRAWASAARMALDSSITVSGKMVESFNSKRLVWRVR